MDKNDKTFVFLIDKTLSDKKSFTYKFIHYNNKLIYDY